MHTWIEGVLTDIHEYSILNGLEQVAVAIGITRNILESELAESKIGLDMTSSTKAELPLGHHSEPYSAVTHLSRFDVTSLAEFASTKKADYGAGTDG